jgi:hypothetical protein
MITNLVHSVELENAYLHSFVYLHRLLPNYVFTQCRSAHLTVRFFLRFFLNLDPLQPTTVGVEVIVAPDHSDTHTHTCIPTHTHIYTYTHTCTHTRTHMHARTNAHHTHTSHAYTHIHTHTHTHTLQTR